MNKLFLILAASSLNLPYASAADAPQGYCAQNVGRIRVNADGTFQIPEQVEINGATVAQNIEQGEGTTKIRLDGERRVEISHEGGKIRQMRYYDANLGVPSADGLFAVTEFNYRNGICYQNRSADFASGRRNTRTDEVGAFIRRDTDACRELLTYFSKNPSATACACGNPGEDAKLGEILGRHQIPVQISPASTARRSGQSYNVRFGGNRNELLGDYSPNSFRIVARAAGDGTYQAYFLVEHCLLNANTRAALNDSRIWAGDPTLEAPAGGAAAQVPAR